MKQLNEHLSLERVASGYNITSADVLDLISKGHLKAVKDDQDQYWVPLAEYQKVGKSLPRFLTEKMMKNLWVRTLEEKKTIQTEVRDQFLKNSRVLLTRSDQTINLLESLHKKYEPNIPIGKVNDGHVASFIVFARIISILNSISFLLKKGVVSESMILFRPLWEAILLAKYFHISHRDGDNPGEIRKWFEKSKLVAARDVRDYLSKKLGYDIEMLRSLNNGYSSFVHHSHNSIMESYKIHSMNGFGLKFEDREGFDYHQTSTGRDMVSMIEAFQNLVQPSLSAFAICYMKFLNLAQSERDSIDHEMKYYSLSFDEKMRETFSKSSSETSSYRFIDCWPICGQFF